MERVLIVNADDYGLSKGQNYGIIEACKNGLVTSTTALVNGAAIGHAAQLSRSLPELAVGMHFVLTLGEPLSAMPGLTRDGRLGKWIWQMAEEDSLPLDEIAYELECQYRRFYRTVWLRTNAYRQPPPCAYDRADLSHCRRLCARKRASLCVSIVRWRR